MRVRVPQAATLHEAAKLLREPALAVWFLFVLLIPFYVVKSGLPQPGDVLIIPLVPLALSSWNGRLNPAYVRALRILGLFTLWVLLVDWAWAIILGNYILFGYKTSLLWPIYYIYNGLVFLVVCVLSQRFGVRFLRLTITAVIASVAIQVIATFVLQGPAIPGARNVGLFNNPNQLGFFALVSASIAALARRRLGFGSLWTGMTLTMCLYLALLSASRAAVIGTGILFALTVISNPKRIVVACLMIFALVAVGGPIADAIEGTQQRMTTDRHPQFNFFEERGYDRILRHKEYWLLGAGEGATDRFVETTHIGAAEVHSSMGTIFFCYGIVGFTMFGIFLFRVVQGAPLRSVLMLAPTLSYTFAHQGLRSTSAWIFFGVFVAFKVLARNGARPGVASKATSAAARAQPILPVASLTQGRVSSP